jgi:hypothetical protein
LYHWFGDWLPFLKALFLIAKDSTMQMVEKAMATAKMTLNAMVDDNTATTTFFPLTSDVSGCVYVAKMVVVSTGPMAPPT